LPAWREEADGNRQKAVGNRRRGHGRILRRLLAEVVAMLTLLVKRVEDRRG